MRTAKTLVRLGGCPGWFESSLGARSLLVLSCRSSYIKTWAQDTGCFVTSWLIPIHYNSNYDISWAHIQYNKGLFLFVTILDEPLHDKTNKMNVRPAKTQITLGILPVWSVFAVRMKKAWVLSYPLIRQGGFPDWSESSLGALILLVLSCCGSYIKVEAYDALWHGLRTRVLLLHHYLSPYTTILIMTFPEHTYNVTRVCFYLWQFFMFSSWWC